MLLKLIKNEYKYKQRYIVILPVKKRELHTSEECQGLEK